MNNGGETRYISWAEDQSSLLDNEDSDGSSSPLVTKHAAPPVAQRGGHPGSPRRNGMVLDAHVRSIFDMTRAAISPKSRSRSPGKYNQASPTPRRMSQLTTGGAQELIPPSLSDLSLQSASSETSWQSPSSTSSRKHSLEQAFDGSPQPKRRWRTEMNNAATSFRYSAPCVQSNFDIDRGERRGGGLRRSGAPIQSLISVADNNSPLSSITSHFGSELEKEGRVRGNALVDPFRTRQRPSQRASITLAPLEEQGGRKRKGYSFWELTSPPAVESIPELGRAEEESASIGVPVSGSKYRAASMNPNGRGFFSNPDTESRQEVRNDTVQDKGVARLSALHALEGTHHQEEVRNRNSGNEKASNPSEENPITMCGRRQYSDWTGHWNGVPRRIPGAGALFPEGYQPRAGDAAPWICPVRDCQTIFAEVWALGGHFSASHRACLLNDNLDGTMSVVGKRKTANPSSGRMPPVVISRNAIDTTTAPPKAVPRPPGRRRKAEAAEQRGSSGAPRGEGSQGDSGPSANPPVTSSIGARSSSLQPVNFSIKKTNAIDHRGSRSLTPVSLTEQSPPAEEDLANSALWQYLMIYLPHDTRLPDSSLVLELLPLNRKRDLPHRWKFQLAGGHPTLKTLCAVLVYLSGIEGPPRCDICAGLDNKENPEATASAALLPFPECVTLPVGVSAELKEYFEATACCNRFYQAAGSGEQTYRVSRFSVSSSDHGAARSTAESEATVEKTPPAQPQEAEQNKDDNETGNSSDTDTSIVFSPSAVRSSPGYKTALPARVAGRPRMVSIRKTSRETPAAKAKRHSSIRRLAAKFGGGKSARREVAVYKPSEDAVEENQEAEKQSTTTESSNGTRRSRRLLEQQQEQQRPESKQSAASKGSGGGGSPSKLRKKETKSISASRTGGKKLSPVPTASGSENKSGAHSLSIMMADWEIAPGRIRMGTGEEADNIAFSSSYLAQGRAVPVTDGTTFQTVEIQPGGSLHWSAEESRTRLCSVARGIIRVKLPDREFPIGPNGMWKVKPGVACTVVNPFYLGAVIHVTMIAEEASWA